MTYCPDEGELELLLSDGESAPIALRGHIESCDRCRAWLEEARADDAVLPDVRAALRRDAAAWPGAGSSHLSLDAPRAAALPVDLPAPRYGPPPRPTPADARPEAPGFRILGLIDSGGMGVVYEAEQAQPRRIVAIKFVRGGTSAGALRNALIEREAAALARLRHVGIAAVYGAGRTHDGLNYIVMERVVGSDLGDFVRSARPVLRERVRLFEQVCRAMHYAHQRGVIHGDLKPGNILIETQDGAALPKILDFGLSRIIEAGEPAAAAQAAAGRVLGSLAYMSPEQAAGRADEIDPRSDVFSLGAVLYELLTGRLPFDPRGRPVADALQDIQFSRPVPPGSHDPRLRGDLDAIVLRAMQTDPAARYQDAGELADDLANVLAWRPVSARPARPWYVAARFTRRHAAAVTLAGLLLVSAAAFAVVGIRQAARIQSESRRAFRISEFLQGMLANIDPRQAGGTEMPLRAVLDDAVRRIDAELGDDPETAAALRLTIGKGYTELGVLDAAETQLSAALQSRRALFGDGHAATAEAMHYLASRHKKADQLERAEPLYAEALAISRRALAPDDPELAHLLNDFGGLRFEQHRLADAESLFREAIGLQKLNAGGEGPEMAVGMCNLASVLFFQGKINEGEAMARESLAVRARIFGENDPAGLQMLSNWTTMLMHLVGDLDASESLQRDLLERRQRLLGPDHQDVLRSLDNLAQTLTMKGDAAGAADFARQAAEIRARREQASASASASQPMRSP